ncbi:MAG: D-alanyl-D-alanine carboxypeptidase [Muribaculaceae bacterium]|nr:D-alanyl-D-alanine carboxypeptidase [Roseburia sp.]MCM1430993.1 D-alanyl-D-alanine carboxypeptidase [Muribaculaceae bacterium]MCM1493773.1 D-alanyl-D-alanine carboxypeptidase [Muribaculaceae bacterium]
MEEKKQSEEKGEAAGLSENELYAKSCALIDGDSGRLLYGKAESDAMANASTTKIMTCILALESGCGNDTVTASAKAAAQPKVHLGMQEGEEFLLMDLLYGLMLESYNDCAVAIAEHVAGSVEAFAELMNEKAEEIGCVDTHFVTPNGLDAEDEGGAHHTTAYDLCRIMKYCAWESEASETFLALTQTGSYSFSSARGSTYSLYNHNNLLNMMENAVTGKTGYTSKAGYCYVAALEEGGRRYCIALLACGWPNNKNYKWADAKKLFGYGMDNYHLYTADESSLDVAGIQVGSGWKSGTLMEWGKRASLNLYVDNGPDTMTFLKADWDTARVEKSFVSSVKLPIHTGDVLGKISYLLGEQVLYSYDICAAEEIHAWDFETFLGALWREYFHMGG